MAAIKPLAPEEADIGTCVARALSLYLSGGFKPPRLTLLGSFVRMSLVQRDREPVAEALSEADLFAQVFTSSIKHPYASGTHSSIRVAATNSEILRPLVRQITHRLLKYGVVTSIDFEKLAKGPETDQIYAVGGNKRGPKPRIDAARETPWEPMQHHDQPVS
jgi:hypothetical protein